MVLSNEEQIQRNRELIAASEAAQARDRFEYDVILCDVPWFYNERKSYETFKTNRISKSGKGRTKFGGGAQKHYSLMPDEQVLELAPQVNIFAKKNCALFLWATGPRLDFAIEVIKAWGFRFCTIAFVWVKISKDESFKYLPGFYSSSNVELVLLGVRGSMRPDEPMIQQVLYEQSREHSRKPAEIRRRIQRMYPEAARLEMFARERFEGWDQFGNEVERFNGGSESAA